MAGKYRDLKLQAYGRQKRRAKARGIPFLLTFKEWVSWWTEQLGPSFMEKRGKTKGKHQMARIKDEGVYILGNIECMEVSAHYKDRTENGRTPRGERNRHAKLTASQVVDIFYQNGTYDEIAAHHGVKSCTINDIKKGLNWKHVLGPHIKKAPHIDRRTLRWKKVSESQM